MKEYQRLGTVENDINFAGPNSNQQHEFYVKPMSFFRLVALILSILLCVFVVVGFLWLLPCDKAQCTTKKKQVEIISWDKTLYGLELKGRLHVVSGNLLGILRGALWGRKMNSSNVINQISSNLSNSATNTVGGGVISIRGQTGEVAWLTRLYATPTYLDCSSLNLPEVKHCLVAGEEGLLVAINPNDGDVIWTMHTPDTNLWPQPKDIDFPVFLTFDLDNDKVTDMAVLCRYSSNEHRVAYVSAKTGVILSEPPLNVDCYKVYDLTFSVTTNSLSYTCVTLESGSKIITLAVNVIKPQQLIQDYNPKNIKFPPPFDEYKEEHRVYFKNYGTCPENCSVSINVTDSKNLTLWTYQTDRAYIMTPLPLHFKHSISGFLLKLWQWHTSNQNVSKSEGNINRELIKERIVLITFNKSGSMHVVNASQTDIIQLCNSSECQPQLAFQMQSALIIDLNGDKSQELISYYVTYRPPKNNNAIHIPRIDSWQLQSRIRVVRLEAELPKLYEAVSKN